MPQPPCIFPVPALCRHCSWLERLYLEEATGAGFDRAFSSTGGFQFQVSPGKAARQGGWPSGWDGRLGLCICTHKHRLRWTGLAAISLGKHAATPRLVGGMLAGTRRALPAAPAQHPLHS